jgi:hypothetical protein
MRVSKLRLDGWNIQKHFEKLFGLGWLTSVDKKRSNDPGTWTVNPLLHKLFAERAKAEIACREAARDVILRIRNPRAK